MAGPQAQLDFHGLGVLTPREITQKVDEFIQASQHAGHNKLLIITGKGLHSQNGAVIKPTVQKHLSSHPEVKSVLTARRDRGGQGALELTLC